MLGKLLRKLRIRRWRYRDAITGEYVTRAYAEAHPSTTVKEKMP